MERLTVDIIAHIISLTSPRDASRSAAVSPVFLSAAVSNPVWERFLPPDYQTLLARSADPIDPSLSRRDLFFRLCDWVLLDNGSMGLRLEKSSGAKCFMLPARTLSIIWSDTPQYWTWITVADSRFSEAAELISVCWLEIRGRIESNILTRNTSYATFLVFKLTNQYGGFNYSPQEASVVHGLQSSTKIVHLQPNYTTNRPILWDRYVAEGADDNDDDVSADENDDHSDGADDNDDDVSDDDASADENDDHSDAKGGAATPRVRNDGWMEISLGEFFNEEGEDGEVAISFTEVKALHWKSGLIVLGIEIRPII